MDELFSGVSASAVSVVVGSTTGVTPFLTLFLIGLMERMDPDLLNMEHIWDGKLEKMLAGNAGLVVLGSATVLEFVSMCIPVVDELVDGAMTFIIPVISVVASHSTFGLFEDLDQGDLNDLGDLINMDDVPINEIFDGIVNGTDVDTPDTIGDGISESNTTIDDLGEFLGDVLEETGATGSTSTATGNILDTLLGGSSSNDGDRRTLRKTPRHMEEEEPRRRRGISFFYQIFLTVIGVGMALSLHLFKMIIRLFGEGWATGCLTIVEVVWTCVTLFIVVHIQPISIVVAVLLLCVASYALYRFYQRVRKRREGAAGTAAPTATTAAATTTTAAGVVTATPIAEAMVLQTDSKPKTAVATRSKFDKEAQMQKPNTALEEEEDAILQVALAESQWDR